MSATNCFLLNLSIVDILNLSLGETFIWSFFPFQLKLDHTMFNFSFGPKVKFLHHNWVPRSPQFDFECSILTLKNLINQTPEKV